MSFFFVSFFIIMPYRIALPTQRKIWFHYQEAFWKKNNNQMLQTIQMDYFEKSSNLFRFIQLIPSLLKSHVIEYMIQNFLEYKHATNRIFRMKLFKILCH